MSLRITRSRKRKMESSHISGDNSIVNVPSPKRAHSSSSLPGSASGDSLIEYHQFSGFVSDENRKNSSGEFVKVTCPLGDQWQEKYPLPLSSLVSQKIRTGNKQFDVILPHIEGCGYRPLLKISQGKFGPIILAQHMNAASTEERECKALAIKFIGEIKNGSANKNKPRWQSTEAHTSADSQLEFPNELCIHQQLDHENIVSLIDSVKIDGLFGMVLDYCAHGNLEQLLTMKAAKILTEPVARHYFIQLHSSLQYLHQQGIAHRDLCLQNILITLGNKIKLCDFGDALRCAPDNLIAPENIGTAGYQAPEIIRKVPYNPRMSDVWSLGVVLYTLITGKLPYGVDIDGMLEKMEKEVPFPDHKIIPLSREVKELIRGLLSYAPEWRYSLNRTKNADFYRNTTKSVQIGNFYVAQKPRKIRESEPETELKTKYSV